MASFLLVIVSKKNKQTKKNMSFIAQCIKNSHKSWKKTRKKHQNDFFGRSLPTPGQGRILLQKILT